jgi:basic membrane protein A
VLADSGHNPIIASGFAYSGRSQVAPSSPTSPSRSSTTPTHGREHLQPRLRREQGSFLVGAAAALKSEDDNVGFIGGVQVP